MSEIKTILVVGLGRFGLSLCERLVELEQRVVAVDIKMEAVEDIADKVELAAQLDVTDEAALEKIGAHEVDVAVVAVGGNNEAAIMATAILKGFKIPHIVARADSMLMAKILARLGANKVVFPAKEMGEMIAEKIVHPSLSRFSRLAGEQLFVGEITPHAEMVGKSLHQLDFRKTYNATVMLVEHKGHWTIPRPDVAIEADDRFMISGKADEIESLIAYIEGGNTSE